MEIENSLELKDAAPTDAVEITNALATYMQAEETTNSLSSLCEAIGTGFGWGGSQQISQVNTLFENNRWYLISNMRQLLCELYVEHGIVQTLIDQPVDDAFRAGFEIKTSQLSKDEIERLKVYLEEHEVVAHVMQGIKWGRLFGGGGVMLITNQSPKKPFNIESINESSKLDFRAIDMWELFYSQTNASAAPFLGADIGENVSEYFDYYGIQVHKSRVMPIYGKQAPSFIRPRLRGWGMSELERLVRSLNQYMKNQDVIFELLDEAKVDVFKIKGLNSALLTKNGTGGVTRRIQMANEMKNYNHALTMDAEDDYAQKQITFTGLAEVLTQIRQGIAADLKMPMTKLFGISASGFNSGEDDIENYNSMIEGEIRSKNKFLVVRVLRICCQKLFGMVPDDLIIEFNPLRILNAKEEEEVKDSQFNRVMSTYTSGLSTAQEAKQSINKDSLLGVEIDEKSDGLPPLMADFGEEDPKVKSATGDADNTKT